MKCRIKDLKSESREKLLCRYGTTIGAFLIIRAISMFAINICQGLTGAGGLVYFGMIFILSLLEGVLIYGEKEIYLDIAKKNQTGVKKIFIAFRNNPDRAIGFRLLTLIVLIIAVIIVEVPFYVLQFNGSLAVVLYFLWMAIIGVAVGYLYLMFSQTLYILIENSDFRLIDALKKSAEMMEGKKLKLFLVYLSFIPLTLVSVLTFLIGSIYLHPYLQQTLAEFYMEAKNG